MPEKNTFEPKVTLPGEWRAFLDENGHPCVRIRGVEYSLREANDREVVLALSTEWLNGKEEYKRQRDEIVLKLLIAQAQHQGQEEPAGPIDPFEQDSLTLTVYLWLRLQEGMRFKGNTHELRKALVAVSQSEKLDNTWWPTTLNWFSRRIQDRARRLKKLGIVANRLPDETRSWEIAAERAGRDDNDAK